MTTHSLLGSLFCDCCGDLLPDGTAPLCSGCAQTAEQERHADDRLLALLRGVVRVYEAEYPGRLAGMDDHGALLFQAVYAG